MGPGATTGHMGRRMELCLVCGKVFDDRTGRCPADGDELLPYEPSRPAGDVVEGGYRVVRVVGVGQCGEVSECREIATDRKVVLRLMAPELTGNRITTELLLRHMMQLREFSHPNVVQVHDVQLHEGRLALVRDWVDGERLVDLLLREGALSVTHSLDVAIQVAEALEAAHKIDLLHLQLRPSNVFLEVGKGSALELARLVDFGIGPQRIVDGRDIFGTIRTLSPEQIEGWDPTLRSDVYSLGLLLYRMVTGRQPFAGTGDDVVRLALEETLPALRTPAGRPVPEALDILVHEMTEKRSSDRPRGMTEVIKRARKIQEAIEDELPFELAFREEHKSSGGGAYREQQTVIIRRSSIAPPPPEPGGKGRSPTPSVPPLFTPRGAERARRESMPPIPPPGMAGQEPADAPASPDESTDDDTIRIDPAMPTARREAHTIMWPALSQGVTKLSSPKGTAAAAKASAATSRAAGRGGSAAATGLMGAAQSAPAAQARLSSRSRRQARQRRHRRRVAGKAAAAGRKPQRTIMGHPAVTASPARPAISPRRPPDEPTVPHGPGQFHGQEPERPPDTMRPTPLVGVEAPPPGPLKPTPYVGVSIPPPGALSDSEPVTMEGIPIPDSIPAGIPVDVVERAERGVQDVFPSGASAPLRPVSIEPPPLMAFGLEPGASLPDVIPARRIRAPPPNRTGLWIALGGLGAAVVAVAVWFLFLRGEGAAGPGAPSAAADAGAAVVAVAAADVGSGAAMDAAPSAEPGTRGPCPTDLRSPTGPRRRRRPRWTPPRRRGSPTARRGRASPTPTRARRPLRWRPRRWRPSPKRASTPGRTSKGIPARHPTRRRSASLRTGCGRGTPSCAAGSSRRRGRPTSGRCASTLATAKRASDWAAPRSSRGSSPRRSGTSSRCTVRAATWSWESRTSAWGVRPTHARSSRRSSRGTRTTPTRSALCAPCPEVSSSPTNGRTGTGGAMCGRRG